MELKNTDNVALITKEEYMKEHGYLRDLTDDIKAQGLEDVVDLEEIYTPEEIAKKTGLSLKQVKTKIKKFRALFDGKHGKINYEKGSIYF